MTTKDFAARHRLKVRRDEDGTDVIPGRPGQCHLYEHGDGRLGVMFMPADYHPHDQRWAYGRKQLLAAGCEIVQNGDAEGAATFDPENREQAKVAIRVAGAKVRRVLSEAHRGACIRRLQSLRPRPGRAPVALETSAGPKAGVQAHLGPYRSENQA